MNKIIKLWAVVGKLNPMTLSWSDGRPLIYSRKKNAVLHKMKGNKVVKVEIKILKP